MREESNRFPGRDEGGEEEDTAAANTYDNVMKPSTSWRTRWMTGGGYGGVQRNESEARAESSALRVSLSTKKN